MARKDQSVAPKERVNIVYKPSIEGADEIVELPLRQLVLGEFTNKPSKLPLEKRQTVSINKDNFNQILKLHDIRITTRVPNRLSNDKNDFIPLDLKIQSLHDFEPDHLVKQVPELRKLMELRNALKSLKGPLGNTPEFRRKLDAIVKDPGMRDKLLKDLGIEEKKDSKDH
ncbi:type VI secretion system contractile sheath small subunit [Legionella genomosp. 1]|uniref:type VI secretion system contractile sheath small subunit n=1 Tax=Legionella genomosp. 1 TaxID=1093625 RepID=UPI001056C8E5|nr:type VI secretion system contractile sheath small subunit [Legionella genomosp. 1]